MKTTPKNFMQVSTPALFLASQSSIRLKLLQEAGLQVFAYNPAVDENTIKIEAKKKGYSAQETALWLACEKAQAKKQAEKQDGYIIAADQIMTCNERWFDKPVSVEEAKEHLIFLRGKTHILHTAAVIFRDGKKEAEFYRESFMTMRPFTDEFLNSYLHHVGEECLQSVGCYKLESYGIRLFETIEGDYTAILGLPLLPILSFLQKKKIVKE
ncbi:Maf family protein [Entomobacter blattae]|uniref:Nucleoside triphosphate pyrophosphatase n=1 Tax=Entomobacter blattae TaxID=2762277 RepID=A0A7H1NPV0_9PROT|nr:Maf family protein [Entomobacter blattae]QNT77810.1 Maf-like protein YhdE [Entomobacter blattae]